MGDGWAAGRGEFIRAHAGRGGSITDHGDADAALAQGEVKIGGTYEAPYLAHAPIEPNNGIARVVGDTAEVWGPTQSPTITQLFRRAVHGGDVTRAA